MSKLGIGFAQSKRTFTEFLHSAKSRKAMSTSTLRVDNPDYHIDIMYIYATFKQHFNCLSAST